MAKVVDFNFYRRKGAIKEYVPYGREQLNVIAAKYRDHPIAKDGTIVEKIQEMLKRAHELDDTVTTRLTSKQAEAIVLEATVLRVNAHRLAEESGLEVEGVEYGNGSITYNVTFVSGNNS